MSKTLDVVAGNIIDDAWGNEIRDRTLQVFASTAERDSQWPTVPNGAVCLTVDTYTRWIRRGGIWEPMWPRVTGSVVGSSTLANSTAGTFVDVPGMSIAVPFYPGHRYWLKASITVSQTVAAGNAYLYITDAANTLIGQALTSATVGQILNFHAEAWATPGAAVTYKLRFATSTGTVTLQQSQYLSVFDWGP